MRRPKDEAVQVAPRRLVEGTDRTAALLWRAQKEPPPGNARDFSALLAKREARVRRMRIGVALVAASLPLGLLLWSERPETGLLIAPERLGSLTEAAEMASLRRPEPRTTPGVTRVDAHRGTRSRTDSATSTSGTSTSGTSTSGTGTDSHLSETTRREGPSRPGLPASPARSARPLADDSYGVSGSKDVTDVHGPTGSASHPEGAMGTPKKERCSAWTSRGDYRAAVDCYDRKARGDGVSAEWALLEKARIHSRAQGKPLEALSALDEYEARFPEGSLAREARLSRIEILTSAGRTGDALRAIDDTLERDQIPERAGELLLLRAQLHAESRNCTQALEDMDAARKRGIPRARTRSIQEKCPR